MKARNTLLLATTGILATGKLLKPRTNKFNRIRDMMCYDFAYNGLWDNKIIPENSIAAYEEAVDNNYGIYSKAVLTKDGQIVLINDKMIKKILGYDIKIEDLYLSDLREYNLLNTDEKVPTLVELLNVVKSKVPLMIRLENTDKSSPSDIMYSVTEAIDGYEGDILFVSSSPTLLHYRMKARPDLIMGQLIERQKRNGEDIHPLKDMLQHNLLMNSYTLADFVVTRYMDRKIVGLNLCRSIYGLPVFYRDVISKEQYEGSKSENVGVIFKNILP